MATILRPGAGFSPGRLVEALTLLVVMATPAASQTPKGSSPTGFVFEVHVGGMPSSLPTTAVLGGSTPLPGPEGNFTTIDGGTSRQVPSWFFGDGTQLANQVAAQIGQTSLLAPLDSVLTGASLGQNSGRNLGLRVGHTITRYVLFTVSFDKAAGPFALSPAAATAVAASTASFQPYWTSLLTRTNTTGVTASSVDTITDHVGTSQIISFVTEVRPVTLYGWRPYVALGSGFAFPTAVTPTVQLSGQYQFTLVNPGVANNGAQAAQTDHVQISYKVTPSVVSVFGGGVERDLMKHLGFRIDWRAFLHAMDVQTRLDSQNATTNPTPTKGVVIRRAAGPELQISSSATQPSTLSGPGVSHLITYEGMGKLSSFSVGFFVRF